MQAVKKALMAAAGVGILALMSATPAAAAGINFTWNPSASGLIAGNPLSTAGAFTSDNMVVSDFATITINPADLSHVQETAILPVTQFQLNGATVTPGGTPFQLYFYVTATSTLDGVPNAGNKVSGAFTALTYTLFGATGSCTFVAATSGPTATCGGTTYTLATGSLAAAGPSLQNNVSVDFGDPSAHALVSSAAGTNSGSFFVTPGIGLFDFESAFTNTPGTFDQTTVGNNAVITINGGGGNVDILPVPVPEPVTLSVFGAGLVGAAALRRRKAKKA